MTCLSKVVLLLLLAVILGSLSIIGIVNISVITIIIMRKYFYCENSDSNSLFYIDICGTVYTGYDSPPLKPLSYLCSVDVVVKLSLFDWHIFWAEVGSSCAFSCLLYDM